MSLRGSIYLGLDSYKARMNLQEMCEPMQVQATKYGCVSMFTSSTGSEFPSAEEHSAIKLLSQNTCGCALHWLTGSSDRVKIIFPRLFTAETLPLFPRQS